jgi:YVTN family beta-propeller protein
VIAPTRLARSWIVPAVAIACAGLLTTSLAALAGAGSGGRVGPAYGISPSGRRLVPAGRMTVLGDFPTGGALSPDGRFYSAVDSGHGVDDVRITDVGSGAVTQVLPLPGAYGAVTFASDGRTAFVSGEPVGNSHPPAPTVARNGDAIHVFAVDPASGHATEQAPIALPATSGGTAQKENANPGSVIFQPPGPGPSSGLGWPIGLAATSDGKLLAVALNQADQVAIVDLAKRTTTALVKVGAYPYGVVVDGHTAYVSNEYDGTVSVIDLDAASVKHTVSVGATNSHPEGMALDAAHHHLFVAVTNLDYIAVVDTVTGKPVHFVAVDRSPGIGTAPVALAMSPDGHTLYSADAGEDAIAAISLDDRPGGFPAWTLMGRVPTAAYPTGVAVTPNGGKLVWLAAKGLGAGPNPLYGQHFAASEAAPYGQYVIDMLLGRLGVLARPSDSAVAGMEHVVDREVRPDDFSDAPVNTPVQAPGGGPSRQIKHVFYVVKENRTYDQVFGTDPRGDGDPKLELFDDNGAPGPAGGVTPNAHALARQFPLLDHFYADSEVSVDGHIITSGAYATDFMQRALHASYAGRGRVLNAGQAPETFPPRGFMFDQAVRQGIPFVNDGEISAGNTPAGNDGRATYNAVVAHTAWGYPLFFGCDNAGLIPVTATNHDVACSTDSGTVGPAGAPRSANSRADFFQTQLAVEVASGTVPAFTYLTLPNDHTNGVRANYPTPRAMVADNDLGLGQIVDAISHSSIWSSSAIFVVEDDSQDGADHVDAHRMPAFVISPWAKRGAVVSTRYDQLSALRTIELMVGLHPLSLYDGVAEPMYDAFIPGDAKPDLTPYTAIAPAQSLTAVSASTAAGIDGTLPFADVDLVPQRLFDAALWRSVYGPNATPPPPGPNASAAEEERAREALAVWRRHGDVAAWLRRHPLGEE